MSVDFGEATILIVEDHIDTEIKKEIKPILEERGYEIVMVENGNECISILQNEYEIDLIIVDPQLPDESGLALLTKIRGMTDALIMVASRYNSTADTVACLELGADDFVAKPFEPAEMIARIKMCLRRLGRMDAKSENSSSMVAAGQINDLENIAYLFNGWRLIPSRMALETTKGEEIHLTKIEFKLLSVLVQKPKIVVNRERLFDLVHDNDKNYDAFERSIDIHINRLRKKLQNNNKSQNSLIKTIYGSGYFFNSDVQVVNEDK